MNVQFDEPHPFSPFIQALARGKTKQRALTLDEAREAMGMILRDEAVAEQVGAFLMLQRLKEETPEELAGFTLGARDTIPRPEMAPRVDIDWSSYAGKRLQLPWFLLSVLTLVDAGFRVVMHGTEGHTPGRLYTRAVLEELGFPTAATMDEAARHLEARRFAYIPLETMSPALRRLIELRPIFGLRSPVHSFARMLNPFAAPVMMQGIFHRSFLDTHAGAARVLGQPAAAVLRGEGGEIERRPNKPAQVILTRGRAPAVTEVFPQTLPDPRQAPDLEMDPDNLRRFWHGATADDYALAAVTGTLSVTLRAMGRAATPEAADRLAAEMWAARRRDLLG